MNIQQWCTYVHKSFIENRPTAICKRQLQFHLVQTKGENKAKEGKAMRLPKKTHAQAAHCKKDY
jgi:hypothetical protein